MAQFDAILNEVQNVENFFEEMDSYCAQMEEQWKQTAGAMKQSLSWSNWGKDEETGASVVGGELAEGKAIFRNYLEWLQSAYNTMFNNLDQMSGSFGNIITYLPDYIEHLKGNKNAYDDLLKAQNDTILSENFFVEDNLQNYVDMLRVNVTATYAIGYNKALLKNINKIAVKMNSLFKTCIKELNQMIKFCNTSDPHAFAIGENAPIATDSVSILSEHINSTRYFLQKRKLKHWCKHPPKFITKFRKITKSINKLNILIEAYHEVYLWAMFVMKGRDRKNKMKFVFNYVYGQFPYLLPCSTLSDGGKNFKHLVNSYYKIQTKGDPDNHISFRQYMEMDKLIKKYLKSDIETFLMPTKQAMSGMYTNNESAQMYAGVIAEEMTKGKKVGCFFLRILSIFTLLCSALCAIGCLGMLMEMGEGETDLNTIIITGVLALVFLNYGYKWWKKSNPFYGIIYKALKVSAGKKGNSNLYNLCVQQLNQADLSKIQFEEDE